MDIGKLAKELAQLRYETGYRFENGESFQKSLSQQDVHGLLLALRDRGLQLSHDAAPHVESPAIFGTGHSEPESTH